MPEIQELNVFYKVCMALMEEGLEKFDKVAFAIAEGMQLLACSIWHKNEDALTRSGFYEVENKNITNEWLPNLDYQVAEEVIRTGEPYVKSSIDDLLKQHGHKAFGHPGIMGLPIKDGQKITGVVNYWASSDYSATLSTYFARELTQQIGAGSARTRKDFRKGVETGSNLGGKVSIMTKIPSVPGLSIAGRSILNQDTPSCFYQFTTTVKSLVFGFGEATGNERGDRFMLATKLSTKIMAEDNYSPQAIITKLNQNLTPELAQEGLLESYILTSFDLNKGSIDYTNAGHYPPLLFRGSSGQVVALPASGPFLGIDIGTEYTTRSLELKEGDFLIKFSRSLVETFNDATACYSVDRLAEIVKKYQFYDAAGILDYIFMDFNDFLGKRRFKEDLSVIVIKVDELNKGKR